MDNYLAIFLIILSSLIVYWIMTQQKETVPITEQIQQPLLLKNKKQKKVVIDIKEESEEADITIDSKISCLTESEI